MICAKMLNQSEARLNCFLQLPMGTAFTLDVYLPVFCCCWWSFDGVFRWQCDQIGQFIGLWATFQSLWTQLFCPNIPHSQAIFCKGVKISNFSSEIIFGQLLQTFGIFLLVTLVGGIAKVLYQFFRRRDDFIAARLTRTGANERERENACKQRQGKFDYGRLCIRKISTKIVSLYFS